MKAVILVLAVAGWCLAPVYAQLPEGYEDGAVDVPQGVPLEVDGMDVRTNTDFYQYLAPHGRWLQVEPYGLVWQPNVAVTVPDWQPYCDDGRWAWTDEGWYWQSNYSWGWAPFHYGRWHLCHDRGWYWVPDTVWAPAWVHWRYSDSHFGWAPLPPGTRFEVGVGLYFGDALAPLDCHFGLSYRHYTFVERRHFLSTSLRFVATSRRVYPDLCRNTTVVRHGLGCSGSRVVTHGLPVETVSSASRRSVQLHHIVRQSPAISRSASVPSRSYTYRSVPSSRRQTVVTRPSPVYYSTPRSHYSSGRSSRLPSIVQSPSRASHYSSPRPSTPSYSTPYAPRKGSSHNSSPRSSTPSYSSPRTTTSPSSRSSGVSSGANVSSGGGRRSDRLKHAVKGR